MHLKSLKTGRQVDRSQTEKLWDSMNKAYSSPMREGSGMGLIRLVRLYCNCLRSPRAVPFRQQFRPRPRFIGIPISVRKSVIHREYECKDLGRIFQ
jgi:hypothetical protein